MTPLQYRVFKMTDDDATKVCDLANPTERQALQQTIALKVADAKTLNATTLQRYLDQLFKPLASRRIGINPGISHAHQTSHSVTPQTFTQPTDFDSKSGLGATLTWVRIPPLPPVKIKDLRDFTSVERAAGA
jgi:hypothetical protein